MPTTVDMTMEDRRRPSPEPTAQPLRLLVVEDDPDYRSYISALTRRLGFRVDGAADGEAALQKLAEATFDVAIIDHEMPRLKGIDAITRIREDEESRALYAVMLTAHEDIDTKLAALRAGFDDFLTKSSLEAEITAKLIAARRVASRQRTMNVTIRDLYGLATRDDLTGVFNRRYFYSEMERLLTEETIVSLVALDLDGFKRINDVHGHSAGDRVLRDVATVLLANTRPEDIVARLGGDEFVVAVPGAEAEQVDLIADRLTTAVEQLEWTAAQPFRVGASAGVASSQWHRDVSVIQLLAAADRNMYVKKRGRSSARLPIAEASESVRPAEGNTAADGSTPQPIQPRPL